MSVGLLILVFVSPSSPCRSLFRRCRPVSRPGGGVVQTARRWPARRKGRRSLSGVGIWPGGGRGGTRSCRGTVAPGCWSRRTAPAPRCPETSLPWGGDAVTSAPHRGCDSLARAGRRPRAPRDLRKEGRGSTVAPGGLLGCFPRRLHLRASGCWKLTFAPAEAGGGLCPGREDTLGGACPPHSVLWLFLWVCVGGGCGGVVAGGEGPVTLPAPALLL